MKNLLFKINNQDELIKLLETLNSNNITINSNKNIINTLVDLFVWKKDMSNTFFVFNGTKDNYSLYVTKIPHNDKILDKSIILNSFGYYNLIQHITNKNTFDKFSYKIQTNTIDESTYLDNFCKGSNFEICNTELNDSNRTYYFIQSTLTRMDVTRNFYNILSSDYLYGRNDDYKKIDFKDFKELLLLRSYFGLNFGLLDTKIDKDIEYS